MPKFGHLPALSVVRAWPGAWSLAPPVPLLLPLSLPRTWHRTRPWSRALRTMRPVLPPALTTRLAGSLVAAGRWAMTVTRLIACGPSRRPWPVPAITMPAGIWLAPADIGALVLGPARVDAPVPGRLAWSRPERALPTRRFERAALARTGVSSDARGRLPGWRLVVPVLVVDRLVPDLRGLPWLHAPSAGWLGGRDDAERVQPLIGLGVAGATRRLQVIGTRVMPLPGARRVVCPIRLTGFALAGLASIPASCGHD